MGTNFYRKRILTEEDRQNLHNTLDEFIDNKIDNYKLSEILENTFEEIHICKRSAGWQVGFDHNDGKYYKPSRKGLEEFLSEPNTYIEDEYGEKISYEDFWKMVDEWNADPRNRWTAESYNEYERSRGNYIDDYIYIDRIDACQSKFGVNCHCTTDFSIDGLRFSVFTNFS